MPSLQSQVNGAEYEVEVETDDDTGSTGETDFTERLAGFLALSEAWRERRKGKEIARYDLRPLIQDLHYTGRTAYGHSFEVTMRAEPGATGRPDELLAELGYESAPRRIIRRRLLFPD